MAAKNAGSTVSPTAKRKRSGGSAGARKAKPELLLAASLPVVAVPSGDGTGTRSRPSAEGGRSRRVPAAGTRPERAAPTPAPARPDAARGEAATGGEAGRGGILGRVAAVGEYGAALGELGRDGLAKAGTLVRRGASVVGEYGTTLGEYGRDGLTKAGDAVQRGASTVRHAAADGLERGRDVTARGWDAYPLAFCGAALALGVVAGLLLPATPIEDKAMGPAADRLNGGIKRAAGSLADRGRSLTGKVLTVATTATSRAAEQEGLTPTEIGRKVKRLAGNVREAVASVVGEA
ncbi:MAG: hypothetical protein JWO31_852 [Phycisphaerales bacterium]|nr:hypothetical protein [Phycisphaerales bacterium]